MRWLLILLLTACTQEANYDVMRVQFHRVEPGGLAKDCPSLIGTSTGCTKQDAQGVYHIYAVVPKNVEDEQAMIPIGHEFYCHVVLKQHHQNVDPSNDCKWPPKG